MSLRFIRYFRVCAIVTTTHRSFQTMSQPEAGVKDPAPSSQQLRYFKIKTVKVYPVVNGKICVARK